MSYNPCCRCFISPRVTKSYCRGCLTLKNREYGKRERVRAQDRKRNKTPKRKAWNLAYRDIRRTNRVKYNYRTQPRQRFLELKRVAKYRGLEFSILENEYTKLILQPCFYCGGVLNKTGGNLDRANSRLGYVPSNVRPCCFNCNVAKNALTETQFKEWLVKIYNKYILGKARNETPNDREIP